MDKNMRRDTYHVKNPVRAIITGHLLCIFIILLFSSSNAFADPLGLGPFDLPPLNPAESFREIPSFVVSDDNAEGKVQLTWTARWTNVWAFNAKSDYPLDSLTDPSAPAPPYGIFLLDMEIHHHSFRFSYLTSPSTRVELCLPFYYISGGTMDSYIEGFHDAWHISQHRRDEWPKNQIYMIFVHPNGERIEYNRDDLGGIFIGNLGLGGSWKIKENNPDIALRLFANLPTTNAPEVFEENDLNITLQSTASWRFKKFILHDGIGFTWYRSEGINGLDLERHRFSFMHTFEYPVSRDFSLILHGVMASPVADYPELDEFNVGLSFGFKRRLNNCVIELSTTENMFFFNNSPDIGVHFAIKTILK
jgi:hypothetical protein